MDLERVCERDNTKARSRISAKVAQLAVTIRTTTTAARRMRTTITTSLAGYARVIDAAVASAAASSSLPLCLYECVCVCVCVCLLLCPRSLCQQKWTALPPHCLRLADATNDRVWGPHCDASCITCWLFACCCRLGFICACFVRCLSQLNQVAQSPRARTYTHTHTHSLRPLAPSNRPSKLMIAENRFCSYCLAYF